MKFFKYSALALAAAMSFASCSDDLGKDQPGDPNANGTKKGDVMLSVNFVMPGMGQGSRSYTDENDSSNNGVEVGTTEENGVSEVLLILARPNDYGYIASAIVNNGITTGNVGNNPVYRAIGEFTKTDFEQYYKDTTIPTTMKQLGQVAVFVVVNPNAAIKDAIDPSGDEEGEIEYGDKTWYEAVGNLEGSTTVTGTIWEENKFLMSNQSVALRRIPTSLDGWNYFTDGKNVFHLSDMNGIAGGLNDIDNSATGSGGSILVERVAARMDIRDGSPVWAADKKDENIARYHVVHLTKADGTADKNTPLIDIVLNKVCLTNMLNRYYVFGRVSDNGRNGEAGNRPAGWQLCGPEKPWFTDASGNVITTPDDQGNPVPVDGNYVVSPWASQKYAQIKTNFSTYFIWPFFGDDGNDNNDKLQVGNGRWKVSNLKDVLAGRGDNWEGNPNGGAGQYKFWTYLTENTLPGINAQTFGQTTVVVFKGKMEAVEANIPDLDKLAEKFGKISSEYLTAQSRRNMMMALGSPNDDMGGMLKAPILYSWNGYLFSGWKEMQDKAQADALSYKYNADSTDVEDIKWDRSASLYKVVYGNGCTGATVKIPVYVLGENNAKEVAYKDYSDVENDVIKVDQNAPNYWWEKWVAGGKQDDDNFKKFKEIATSKANQITIYQRSQDDLGWGYYCYYYYKNRHNDNGNNGVMGPMEFAVVRNNVYKLAVTDIKALGHPRILLNDPFSPKPGDPDESEDLSISVDAEVLPWVVRVNDIVFQ